MLTVTAAAAISGATGSSTMNCAHGLVILHANRAVMVFDDAADDRQSQSGAAFLGRKIGQEEFLLSVAGDAAAGVGDNDLHPSRLASSEVAI